MKRVSITLLSLFFVMLKINPVSAQVSNEEMRSKLKFRPSSEVRKVAKDYRKQCYYVANDAPSVECQLTNGFLKEQAVDETGFPKYIVATGRAVGETQIEAKLQATENAKVELVEILTTNFAASIEIIIANAQMEEAASVSKIVATSKNMIAQEIGQIITLVEMYKDIDKKIEANVRIAYNSKMALEAAKNIVRKQLEDQTNFQKDKIDKLMEYL